MLQLTILITATPYTTSTPLTSQHNMSKPEETKDKKEEEHPLKALINKYAKDAPPKPFLQHVDYFRDDKDGGIDKQSIGCKWSKLTQENYPKTLVKGHITITGANLQAAAKDKTGKCPWQYKFASSEDLMPHLKHPCDTGIVNADGSINVEHLTHVMTYWSNYDKEKKQWVMKQPVMNRYLQTCVVRDKNEPQKAPGAWFFMPGWKTVAQAEWDDCFANFCDHWVVEKNGEVVAAMTADTLLQFYFQPTVLFKRKLAGELPASKP